MSFIQIDSGQHASNAIRKLPTEILAIILAHVDEVSAICFGLTCKLHHAVHKLIYPIPLPIWTPHLDTQAGEYWVLYELLDAWKGPDLVCAMVKTKPFQLPAEREKVLYFLHSWERSLDLIKKYKDAYEVPGLVWDENHRAAIKSTRKNVSAIEEGHVSLKSWRFVSLKNWLEMEKTHWSF